MKRGKAPTLAEVTSVVIVGAGGHGAVCAELADLLGLQVVGFLDDHKSEGSLLGHPLVSEIPEGTQAFFVAIGAGDARARHFEALRARGLRPVSLVHPTAVVSPSAELGDGVFVGPLALVHTRARVLTGAIVNSGALVEHDAEVGRFAHLASGAIVGPSAVVAPFAVLGAGERATQG